MVSTPMQERWLRQVEIAIDHPAFDGHFPGRPLLPGVALVAEVLEAALAEPALAACIGTEPRLEVVKFLKPVLPGARLALDFRIITGGLEFTVDEGGQRAVSGRFSTAAAATPRP